MIEQRLNKLMRSRRCTLLGVGPMSQICVDATIELANEFELPLFLIASRRQIDAEEFGGGYVNNWSTERFAEYVVKNDRKGMVILARDHGGPWQNATECANQISLRSAMESAKASFKADIESGFEVIHIDPSVDIFSNPTVDETLFRLQELYTYCWDVAQRLGRKILFEVGTEEQSGGCGASDEVEYVLSETVKFCDKNKLPHPYFVVVQTGTRVLETRNVGTLDAYVRVEGELPAEIQVPKMVDMCNKFNICLKQHNTDYLSDENLRWHPKLGIHAANVAPEFGVVESRAFINLLNKYELGHLSEKFVEIAYKSQKWVKWMAPDSDASDFDKAVIAGHYVFADPEFLEVKRTAQESLGKHNIVLDEHLMHAVKASIMRYLRQFRLLG
jgi:hypothetical protein